MIKKVTDRKYLEQIHELGSYAFNSNHTKEQRDIYLKKNESIDNYVDEVDGQVTSQVVSYPYQVTINGQVMGMSGIGDVATYPEARGTGSIRLLFEAIFNDLHEKGTELSYLAPFSQSFYRKFGYENIFDYDEIRIPKETIVQIKPEKTGSIKRVSWENKEVQETIKELYRKTLGTHNGSLVREDYWWEFVLTFNQGRRLAIAYDDKKQACGYIVYGLIGASEFMIYEMSYTNLFGLKKLMTFVSSHSGSFDEFVSTNLPDPKILELFTETQNIVRKTHSSMMARIVNFKEFIEKFNFKSSPTKEIVYLEVIDSTCSWNNGIFKLSIVNGKSTCEKIDPSNEPMIHYSGSIQRWTQVFMGRVTFEEAQWLNLIDSKNESTNFSELFSPSTPRLYDYF
ncbi:GNAT family N-acetyltransferase [Vagococcus carniphilus]|uniref:GNAT family N-acetyltransferase n=1 Tax=Vagococcus carniphilus TaxID=218144 RepID=UPI00288D02B0|nr:GNAT family N-acetyltransferase [Vagococcus carniphilus]MDT2831811.1 GNAT family N-acetyltransferase [Vagococcus carniphilus]MDT2840664.1 GNAT family N-acetyltransferase [Vagococcus carniphilus]MDT2855321.1 GNAT family N-acetyltransferase [Vagococcus carniphilus]